MNEHLSAENLAKVREKGRHEIYLEPAGLRVTTADLIDEIARLRSALAEALLLTGGNGFEVIGGPLGRAHDRIEESCRSLGVTTDDFA